MTSLQRSAASALRGISQIFLAEHAISGLLILLAMALSSWRLATLAVVGSLTQLALGAVLREDGLRHGLMGYNGALVGAAAAASGAPLRVAVPLALVGAAAVIPLQRLFDHIPRVPAFTAPFCIVAGLLFGPFQGVWEASAPVTTDRLGPGLLSGFLDGFSEVVLADGILPGAIILAALAVASLEVAAFALLGSALGLAFALVAHPSVEYVSTGLLNYSTVLIAIAVGTVLWSRARWSARVAGAVVGVALTCAIQWVMSGLAVPTYTWPFVLAAWIFALLPPPPVAPQN